MTVHRRAAALAVAALLAGLAGCGSASTPREAGEPRTGSTAGSRPTLGAGKSAPRTVIRADFDARRPGPVDPDSFRASVGPTTREDGAYDSMTYVRAPGRGTFVRTRLAANRILDRNDRPGDGNVLVVPLEDQSQNRACVSYDVRFSRDFRFAAGGKLPGLLGVAPGVPPGTPTGGGSTEHGWSGRVMWLGPTFSRTVRESGQPDLAVSYLYHPGQARAFGDDLYWGRGFVDGVWHQVRQCYTLNKIGRSDGVLRAWLDGVPVLERGGLVYRTDPKVHITHLDWSVFRGGGTLDWAADTAGDVDLDNLKVTVG